MIKKNHVRPQLELIDIDSIDRKFLSVFSKYFFPLCFAASACGESQTLHGLNKTRCPFNLTAGLTFSMMVFFSYTKEIFLWTMSWFYLQWEKERLTMHRILRVFNDICQCSRLVHSYRLRHTDPKHWYTILNSYFSNAVASVGIVWCEQTMNKSIECGKTRWFMWVEPRDTIHHH